MYSIRIYWEIFVFVGGIIDKKSKIGGEEVGEREEEEGRIW